MQFIFLASTLIDVPAQHIALLPPMQARTLAEACFEQNLCQVSHCCLLVNFQVVCYHLAVLGLLLIFFSSCAYTRMKNSTVPHQQQVMVLVQGLCVQAASAPRPGAVWKMDTDLRQSLFSSLPFSPGTSKPPTGSMASADHSSAGSACLTPMKSPFVWRKFSAAHLRMRCSPLLVPELCKVVRAEQKMQLEQHVSCRLQSYVPVDGYCLGHRNHRGLHLLGLTGGCFCGFGKRNSTLLTVHSLGK